MAWCCSQVVGRFIRRPWKGAVLLERHQERPQGFLYGRRLGRREGLRVSICASQLECGRRASWPCRDFDLPGHGIEHTCRDLCLFSIFVLVVSKGWKPGVAPPLQRRTVDLNHCARFVSCTAIPPLSTLTSRATHAHPTSPRSTGFCATWDCISSSSQPLARINGYITIPVCAYRVVHCSKF